MNDAPTIATYRTRDAWLAARRLTLGSSDARQLLEPARAL